MTIMMIMVRQQKQSGNELLVDQRQRRQLRRKSRLVMEPRGRAGLQKSKGFAFGLGFLYLLLLARDCLLWM